MHDEHKAPEKRSAWPPTWPPTTAVEPAEKPSESVATKPQNVETPKPVDVDRIEKVEAEIKDSKEIVAVDQDRLDQEEAALRELKAEKRTVKCTNCGQKNPFEATVCERCGYDRLGMTPSPEPPGGTK